MHIHWINGRADSPTGTLTHTHTHTQWLDFTEITCGESWPVELTYDPIKKSCIASHPTKKVYYTMVTIALFFVPITVMSTAYICVVWKLWANVLPGEPNIANINHQDQARKKVVTKYKLRTVRLTNYTWFTFLFILHSNFLFTLSLSLSLLIWNAHTRPPVWGDDSCDSSTLLIDTFSPNYTHILHHSCTFSVKWR